MRPKIMRHTGGLYVANKELNVISITEDAYIHSGVPLLFILLIRNDLNEQMVRVKSNGRRLQFHSPRFW